MFETVSSTLEGFFKVSFPDHLSDYRKEQWQWFHTDMKLDRGKMSRPVGSPLGDFPDEKYERPPYSTKYFS